MDVLSSSLYPAIPYQSCTQKRIDFLPIIPYSRMRAKVTKEPKTVLTINVLNLQFLNYLVIWELSSH